MSNDEQIAEARRARKRRSRFGNTVYALSVLMVLGFVIALGRSPLLGVAGMGMAITYSATRMYVDGADELQRRRAITACAIGCGAGIAWVVIDALRVTATGNAPDGPGRTLGIAAAAWLLSEVLFGPRRDKVAEGVSS